MRAIVGVAILAACGGTPMIFGTTVADTAENRRAVIAVEEYRVSLERDEYDRLVAMADPSYRECRRAPDAREDCVTIDNLQRVLSVRFAGTSLGYAMRYERATRIGDLLRVDVTVDMRYIRDGIVYSVRAPHTLVLDARNRRFTSGMVPPPARAGSPDPRP
jgi:hypothetical protein